MEEGHNFAYETLLEVNLNQTISPDTKEFQKHKTGPADHQSLSSLPKEFALL